VAWFLGTQPISIATLFLTRSPAIDDDTLVAIARTQGPDYARAIAARDNLSVRVVDALVALHQGHGNGRRATAPEPARPDETNPVAEREEQLRLQLKSLVHRDTVIGADIDPDGDAEMQQALLVRFARLRQARDFSALLAGILGSSLWLSHRIMLDISGLQLATALIAVETPAEDGVFALKQFYPHLAAMEGDTSRAERLWFGLNADECRDRTHIWIRADNLTQGKRPEEEGPANANEQPAPLPVQRAVFGRARSTVRR
jgi:uncharacterized protein (DUF2336 family)